MVYPSVEVEANRNFANAVAARVSGGVNSGREGMVKWDVLAAFSRAGEDRTRSLSKVEGSPQQVSACEGRCTMSLASTSKPRAARQCCSEGAVQDVVSDPWLT